MQGVDELCVADAFGKTEVSAPTVLARGAVDARCMQNAPVESHQRELHIGFRERGAARAGFVGESDARCLQRFGDGRLARLGVALVRTPTTTTRALHHQPDQSEQTDAERRD